MKQDYLWVVGVSLYLSIALIMFLLLVIDGKTAVYTEERPFWLTVVAALLWPLVLIREFLGR